MAKKADIQKAYMLTFKLYKHKSMSEFEYYLKLTNPTQAMLDDYIKKYCKIFEDRFGTPIKCVKIEERADYPEELKPKEDDVKE